MHLHPSNLSYQYFAGPEPFFPLSISKLPSDRGLFYALDEAHVRSMLYRTFRRLLLHLRLLLELLLVLAAARSFNNIFILSIEKGRTLVTPSHDSMKSVEPLLCKTNAPKLYIFVSCFHNACTKTPCQFPHMTELTFLPSETYSAPHRGHNLLSRHS